MTKFCLYLPERSYSAMEKGIVFSIEEFAIHDGPGIRTTVFLKGCPLRCAWCHNPEGISPEPQYMDRRDGRTMCGYAICSGELAGKLLRNKAVYAMNRGGVTLTGGEPLLYPAFRAVYLAVRKRGMIVTVNTNGTLLNEDWAAFFAKNPPRRVNITLYGASGETYKSLCGDETGYAKAMRGIRLLQAHGVPVKVGVSVVRQNRHDLETLLQIAKEQDLELEPDTYMMSTESGQHEARLSPEEAAAASLAATRIKLGTVGFHKYAQRRRWKALFRKRKPVCAALRGGVRLPSAGAAICARA